MKKAEGSDALVFRFHNPAEDDDQATILVDPDLIGSVTGATEVDLLERPMVPSSAGTDGNKVTVTVPAYGIATVRVDLGSLAVGADA